ncbi:winged helix DNA-binding domain-containing protein, partial [Schizopora paradoxa]
MPVRREKTLHDLFGLDPGVEISLEALKDPAPGQKPEYTYPTLMKVAIWSSPKRMLTLNEIYDALEKRFPYFKECPNPNSWKTSLRHSLSLIAIFQKKPRPPTDPGKGSYWTLDLSKGEGNKRERKR